MPKDKYLEPRPSCETPQDLLDLTSDLMELSRKIHYEAYLSASEASTAGGADLVGPAAHLTAVEGLNEINRAIQGAVDRAREEILTAQPDGPRPRAVLSEALDTVRAPLDSGVAMRTLYQHSARFDEATKEYVRSVASWGVKVRTLPEFFERMIIVDRSIAFIPASCDRTRALQVTEPSLTLFLVDVFERAWDRAEPYPFVPARSADIAPEVIPSLHESIKQMLVAGHSDRVIARRLGISERSLQTHIGRIKAQYGAENRLQLGFLIGRADG